MHNVRIIWFLAHKTNLCCRCWFSKGSANLNSVYWIWCKFTSLQRNTLHPAILKCIFSLNHNSPNLHFVISVSHLFSYLKLKLGQIQFSTTTKNCTQQCPFSLHKIVVVLRLPKKYFLHIKSTTFGVPWPPLSTFC